MDTATKLFTIKWPIVFRAVNYHSDRLRMNHHDREDFSQEAAHVLWVQCRRAVRIGFTISAQTIGLAAWGQFKRRRRRPGDPRCLPLPEHAAEILPAARPATILVDGVEMSLAEASQDDPGLVNLIKNGESAAELARRLGVTRQAVMHRPHRFGGRKIGSHWYFPAGAGMIPKCRSSPDC